MHPRRNFIAILAGRTDRPDEQDPGMPTTKRTARKSTKKAAGRPLAKNTARKTAKRTLSASHKKALAEGRTMSATVDRYLAAVNTPKRRGRKVSKATLEQRLVQAQGRANSATGVEKVLAAQEVRDLQSRIAQAKAGDGVDFKQLESAFVKIAKTFGENRGITYGAWRDAGVPADVLKRAGIARTRG
jgi:hypothetical protein